jgi:hypothetical protein
MASLPTPQVGTLEPAPPPAIPVGLGTKLGLVGTAGMSVVALVTAVAHGDHTYETLVSLAGAVALLYKVCDGRYRQAAAAYQSTHNVFNTVDAALTPAPGEEGMGTKGRFTP